MIGIIENVIGDSHARMLLEIAQSDLKYQHCDKTVDEKFSINGQEYVSYTDKHTYDEGHQSCLIIDTHGNVHDEVVFSLSLPIVLSIKDAFPELKLNRVLRLKYNILDRKSHFPEYSYNMPHHDAVPENKKLYSIVYYLNDCDGDTYLFDQFAKDDRPIVGDLTLNQRISPKKNTAVIFESNRMHAGSNPKLNDKRYVINIVVETK